MKAVVLSEVELERICILEQVRKHLINGKEASQQLAISPRQVRRLLRRLESEGADGIKRRPSGGNRAFEMSFKTEVLSAVKRTYADFGPTFAAEKLEEREGLKVNRETLRQWMIEEEIWTGRKRRQHRIHQSRERRPRLGELIQIDGSHHDWFEGRAPKCCLYVFIDDATSRIVAMRFESSETTAGYFRCLDAHLAAYGRPVAYYSDRHSIFITTRPNSETGRFDNTQFHRALCDLGIELICAYSPQAKGRVERSNGVLQDRLIKEMRLLGISSIEDGNAYLLQFIQKHNKRFAVEAAQPQDAHRPLHHSREKLLMILSEQAPRRISKNLEVSHNRIIYKIQHPGAGYRLQRAEVLVCECFDGSVTLIHKGQALPYLTLEPASRGPILADRKAIDAVFNKILQTPPANALSTIPQPQPSLA